MAALDRGWIPRGSLVNNPHIESACSREDSGDFLCVVKKAMGDKPIQKAVAYAFKVQNITDAASLSILNMTGSELKAKANQVIGDYFQKFKVSGATCDFGGVAMLVEESRKPTDDDIVYLTDDEYYGLVVQEGPKLWVLILSGFVVAVVSGVIGFILAMRYNPRFNEKVRKSQLFLPISSSKNSLIRSSLNLPALENYDEIQDMINQEREHLEPLRF
jgi:hypothetical protein